MQVSKSKKLAEFLGLMRPGSQSKTFANDTDVDALSPVVPKAKEEDENKLHVSADEEAEEHLRMHPDPMLMDDGVSDLDYLKSRMQSSGVYLHVCLFVSCFHI